MGESRDQARARRLGMTLEEYLERKEAKAAARELGISLEEYLARKAGNERYCHECEAWHPVDDKDPTAYCVPKKNGKRRRRRKGKGHQPSQPREYPPTVITGAVGVVTGLHEMIDQRLKETDSNWTALAEAVPVSRQYISDSIRRGSLPQQHFERICGILGWDPSDVLELTYTPNQQDHQ